MYKKVEQKTKRTIVFRLLPVLFMVVVCLVVEGSSWLENQPGDRGWLIGASSMALVVLFAFPLGHSIDDYIVARDCLKKHKEKLRTVKKVICPKCGGKKFQQGPRGGAATNIKCICGHKMSVTPLFDGSGFWVENI